MAGKSDGKKALSTEQHVKLLKDLEARFDDDMNRHPRLKWAQVSAKLEANPVKMWSLHEMETTGGEPDVIGHDQPTDQYTFCDFSAETPAGRRSLCYDREGLESRKEHRPENCAMDVAARWGSRS